MCEKSTVKGQAMGIFDTLFGRKKKKQQARNRSIQGLRSSSNTPYVSNTVMFDDTPTTTSFSGGSFSGGDSGGGGCGGGCGGGGGGE